MSPDDAGEIARTVGIAALKYADLSQNRESDYVFSYDKMLALNGNTATYMQYSYARCHGIFARGGVTPADVRNSDAQIDLREPPNARWRCSCCSSKRRCAMRWPITGPTY